MKNRYGENVQETGNQKRNTPVFRNIVVIASNSRFQIGTLKEEKCIICRPASIIWRVILSNKYSIKTPRINDLGGVRW